MNIVHHIEAGRRNHPDRPAVTFEGRTWTYAEVDRLASQNAAVFGEMGVSRGDRVDMYLPNCPEWIWTYLGILKLGAVAVPVSAALRPAELATQVMDSDARLFITSNDLFCRLPPETMHVLPRFMLIDEGMSSYVLPHMRYGGPEIFQAVDMAADDPAVIVYTSGTTGRPKGATLSHNNVIENARAKVHYLGIRPDDRLLLFLPLHHCFGQNAVLNSALQAGASVVLQARFDPERILAAAGNGEISMLFGVPPTFATLLQQATPADLSKVRYFFSAAAPLPPEVERRWQETFGRPIYQGYGLSETSPFASYNHLTRHQPGSIGTPIDGVEMKVVNPESGEELAPGEIGEIAIKGHNVMLGYWRQPEETSRVLRDGWFYTGDLGDCDGEGYFYLRDRVKDVINVGGLKVYPVEVDGVLSRCPGVADVATFGVPDPILGEQVRAAVVLSPQARLSAGDIAVFCRERLAGYKAPSHIDFVDSIPRSPTGKILRRVLREEWQERGEPAQITPEPAASFGHDSDADRLRDWISAWLAHWLGIETKAIEIRSSFADLGMTSMLAIQLARELSTRYDINLSPTALWSYPTVDSLVHHVLTVSPQGDPA